jgi:small subunit ribosomal protein S16
MLTIRLFRVGKKNQPAYKIVVTDKRNAASRGRFVEEVGFYNPLTKQRNLKEDRVKYWISVGAKPSDTVHNMLVADSVVEGAKIAKHKKIAPKADVSAEASAKVEETPADVPAETSIEGPKEEPKTEETPPAEEPEKPKDA